MRAEAGMTFVELLMASLISAAVGGGTLMAFVTAARISSAQMSPAVAEANGLAAQTIERFRNRVAADDATLGGLVGAGWQADPLPGGAGSESIQAGARRCYQVAAACGGGCYQFDAKVCWGDLTGCPCP